MNRALMILSCVGVLIAPSVAGAQAMTPPAGAPVPMQPPAGKPGEVKPPEQPNPRFVRTLTNVEIELSLTDQSASKTPDKKTVTMIASSGSWGKIRSGGTVFPIGDKPYAVELNVDARPFVAVDGVIQVELTVVYAPVNGPGDSKTGAAQRPSGINQSQTVILQSGKPLVVSQAADPVSDRKVVVEVKATVLK